MSADNWAICPQCKFRTDLAKDDQRLKAGEAYGKVESAEYLEMLREAENPVEYKTTFREDYELGVDEAGYFRVSYRGSCGVCGLSHEFEQGQQIDLSPDVTNTSGRKRKP